MSDWQKKEKVSGKRIFVLSWCMILRNGTVVSSMAKSKIPPSRNSYSSEEVNNKGEHRPSTAQPLEPVLTPVLAIGRAITT